MNEVSNEDLYAAIVSVLAKMLEADQRAKGVQRFGGYEADAARVICQTKKQLGYS